MLFTPEEINFMREVVGLNFDFNNLSDDEWCELEEKDGDTFEFSGLDDDYRPNDIGLICDRILSKIP